MIALVKCDCCHRHYRGQADWFIRFFDGYPAVVLCAKCSPSETSSLEPDVLDAMRTFFRTGAIGKYIAVHA